jgi:myo-inositol 2-dehydrogenase / D-chiro-inositol 1-dehydrogenase
MTQPTNDSTTRRNFIKTSATAALGAGLLANLNLSARAYAGGSDTIRVGLIGCGGRGRGAAVQALSTEGDVKLVAVGDAFANQIDSGMRSIESALKDQAKERVTVEPDHKFVGFDAYKQVIDSDVDLVILATPPGFRPMHIEAAVNAGKHVFTEKPVAVDAPGVRSVLESVRKAKEKNLAIGVGLQRHHENSYLETMKHLLDGAIGDIVAMRVYWNGGGVWDPRVTRQQVKSEMEYQMRNWYYYNWLCGDHIVEQHIHNLDVGNWLKNAYPVTAWGMGGREVRKDKKYGEIYDHHAVEYAYADGTRMYSQCRHIRNCWNSVSEHAQGTRGTADISGASYESGETKWRYRGPKNNPYQTEHDNLFHAIRNGIPYNEGENGAYSTLTAIMGRLATYSGKPIEWDKALKSNVSLMPAKFSFDADPPVLPNENGEYPIAVPGVTEVL